MFIACYNTTTTQQKGIRIVLLAFILIAIGVVVLAVFETGIAITISIILGAISIVLIGKLGSMVVIKLTNGLENYTNDN
jgi:hypothetical protein